MRQDDLLLAAAATRTIIIAFLVTMAGMIGGWIDGVLYDNGLIAAHYVRDLIASTKAVVELLAWNFERTLASTWIGNDVAHELAPLTFAVLIFGIATFILYLYFWLRMMGGHRKYVVK